MATLSHQSAVNTIKNFWAKNGGLVPSAPPASVLEASVISESFSELTIPYGGFIYLFNYSFPTLPYDVYYIITASTNINSGGIDSEEFFVGLNGTSMTVQTPSNIRAGKGWYGIPLAGGYLVPAGLDGETIGLTISNISPSMSDLYLPEGTYSWNIIAIPVPPSPP
jgi:hypothetical protein